MGEKVKIESKLLTTEQAAEYLNVSMSFLEKDRWRGANITYVVLGTRTVRYLKSVLEEYLEKQTRCSTCDKGAMK